MEAKTRWAVQEHRYEPRLQIHNTLLGAIGNRIDDNALIQHKTMDVDMIERGYMQQSYMRKILQPLMAATLPQLIVHGDLWHVEELQGVIMHFKCMKCRAKSCTALAGNNRHVPSVNISILGRAHAK